MLLLKQQKAEGNLSQGLISCQNSFLVDQSLISKPNSEQLSDGANLKQHKQSSDSHSSQLKDQKSGSSPSCAKTKSARLEAFFTLETSKENDPASGQKQQPQFDAITAARKD